MFIILLMLDQISEEEKQRALKKKITELFVVQYNVKRHEVGHVIISVATQVTITNFFYVKQFSI